MYNLYWAAVTGKCRRRGGVVARGNEAAIWLCYLSVYSSTVPPDDSYAVSLAVLSRPALLPCATLSRITDIRLRLVQGPANKPATVCISGSFIAHNEGRGKCLPQRHYPGLPVSTVMPPEECNTPRSYTYMPRSGFY